MQTTGTIKLIKEAQSVSEKFEKREFVLIDNSSQYPQYISFQLTQDRCKLLDMFKEGDYVTVQFNLRGREWTSPHGEIKYFNTLEAYKIDRAAAQPKQMSNPVTDDNSNDLPF